MSGVVRVVHRLGPGTYLVVVGHTGPYLTLVSDLTPSGPSLGT